MALLLFLRHNRLPNLYQLHTFCLVVQRNLLEHEPILQLILGFLQISRKNSFYLPNFSKEDADVHMLTPWIRRRWPGLNELGE